MQVERTVHTGLRVLGDIFGNTLDISGLATLNTLEVLGAAAFRDPVTFDDPVTFGDNVVVNGELEVIAQLTVNGPVLMPNIPETEPPTGLKGLYWNPATGELSYAEEQVSNWIQDVNGINYQGGNVGIGAESTSLAQFFVSATQNDRAILIFNNYDSTPYVEFSPGSSVFTPSIFINRTAGQQGADDHNTIGLIATDNTGVDSEVVFGVRALTNVSPGIRTSEFFINMTGATNPGNNLLNSIFRASGDGKFLFSTKNAADDITLGLRNESGTLYTIGYNAGTDKFNIGEGDDVVNPVISIDGSGGTYFPRAEQVPGAGYAPVYLDDGDDGKLYADFALIVFTAEVTAVVNPLLAPLQSDITALQSDVGILQGQMIALQAALGGAQTNITALQVQVAQNTSDITVLQNDTIINAGNISINTSDIATNSGLIAGLAGDILTLQGDVTTNTSNIAANTAAIDALGSVVEIVIPTWNMDVTNTITIPHGQLNKEAIKSVSARIRNDSDTLITEYVGWGAGRIEWDDINIILTHRTSPGYFDNGDYNGVGFDRGILYLKID